MSEKGREREKAKRPNARTIDCVFAHRRTSRFLRVTAARAARGNFAFSEALCVQGLKCS